MPTPPSLTADQAVALLRPGMHVFIHGACATPTPLIQAMCARADLTDITLYHLHTEGPAPFADPALSARFRSVSLFTGPALRPAVADARADFIPVFLSDIPALFASARLPLDAALVQLSPPDRHALCTLGTSVDCARAAVDAAPIVIAEINARMPRTHGHTAVPLARLAATVHTDRPLPTHERPSLTDTEHQIAHHVAELVENASCLQLGIGAIPDAVALALRHKTDLAVHTEMFSDGVVDLALSGAITNKHKAVHPGRTVTSFVVGSPRVLDFVHDNPLVEFHPCDRTNDTALIRKNDRVVAVNSALQIDLTGQVCADSLGHAIYSGIGGQMDFIRGAALSRHGKPIIALPATAKDHQISRITHELAPGAGVVTTRGHVHWVVTEFGAVNLHALSLRQRAHALIAIAHPDHRAELARQAKRIRHFIF